MKTANKGEWSEFYVFLKLLGDGQICAADSDLQKIEDLCFPLIKVVRKENDSVKEFINNSPIIKIIEGESKNCLLELPVDEFKAKAEILLSEIKNAEKTFSVPEIEQFMDLIDCSKIKADSTDKSDINIVLHDTKTLRDVLFGFSIKSKLGGSSTLLNAGKTTNFIYEIIGDINSDEINAIDTRSKIKDRVNAVLSAGSALNFISMESGNFYSNLQVVDTVFPEMLSDILKFYYKGDGVTIVELVERLKELNPFSYDLSSGHTFYECKMKNFLTCAALGMMPSVAWTGRIDATGGYIVVREDGEIVCYHLYNRNEFEDYLYKNTKLETASTTKYDFGKIYTENNKNYMKLNLQIRFI